MLNYNMDLLENRNLLNYTASSLSERFPYQFSSIGHLRVGKNFYTERQGDDSHQIIFTVSGDGFLKYRNKTVHLEQHQAVLINCHEYNYYYTGKSDFWEYKFIHLKGAGMPSIFELINQTTVYPVHLIDPFEFNQNFDKITRLIETMDYQSELKFPALVLAMLTKLTVNRNQPAEQKHGGFHHHVHLIEQSFRYIEQHLHQKLLIRDVAKSAGFNECYFSRLFKRTAGIAPHEYVIRLRIDKSKQLLKQTNKPVTEISADIGFDNVNVFIRNFKKYTGTTPLRFRNYTETY